MNPVQQAQYIEKEYKEYLKSSFKFGNDDYQAAFNEQLSKEELYKGPYLDLTRAFSKGKSIRQLQKEGILCDSFSSLGGLHLDRTLYAHQETSIRKVSDNRNVVITTGTGSGKTECFLYPILNTILSEIEKGNNETGIRAIFLYPMNALVNDQMDRVRKILTPYKDIKFGFFTGETKETAPKNYRDTLTEENGFFIPENELVSREEIRENPPHLLFTNYSMLEYLMIRPNDYALFTPKRLKNWKYVVLDEAHTYSGALGIEVSYLLRRLTGLSEYRPNFILTSATLGKEGEDEDDIIKFASKLTSVRFEKEDIIFAKREKIDRDKVEYRLPAKLYTDLKSSLENHDRIKDLAEDYIENDKGSTREILYNLMMHNEDIYDLYDLLANGSRQFKYIENKFADRMSQEELIALIDLINAAEKDGTGIFDIKYHSFVRALSGAYLSFGGEHTLTLTKTNYIDGFKAFEVGNCKYCNSTYVIGKVRYSDKDGRRYLYQNDEIDIYENYGDNDKVDLDYFLIQNAISDDAEVDELEEYKVCAKCGCVYSAIDLNAEKCDCGEEYKISLYKVDSNGSNNISSCPCCGRKSNGGIVRTLNLGKDEGTAIIAQMLFQTLDKEEQKTQNSTKKLSLSNPIKVEEKDEYVKQFLAFSDSRQQASFFALFFDTNHTRMLQKRLLWKAIEDNNYQPLQVDYLASYLKAIIRERELLKNGMSDVKNAWIAILVELLKVDGAYGGEGLGLFHFELDLDDIMANFSEADVADAFGQYNIDKKDMGTLIQMIFSTFRTTPAIRHIKSTLTPDEKKDALEYRRFDNFISLHNSSTQKGARSFLPIKKNAENMITRYVSKVCGCDTNKACEIMELLFKVIGIEGEIFTKHELKSMYQIDASKYTLKNYKTTKYYVCQKCGRITPFNIHNKCVEDKCDGTLIECDPDVILKDNYYRRRYLNMKIEGIVTKEHTAQLDRRAAKQYQNDFRDKLINILSCSTTFEMGVDLGGLETVFMRNVPPTPANYVQRAGRAGRRQDSSAFIITYCGVGSHDYTYFDEPEKMISGVITPPYFDVTNRKIILRHLMAASLGFFFREYPEYFKSIDNLVFEGGLVQFTKYINSVPKDLNSYINDKVLVKELKKDYEDFKWFNDSYNSQDIISNFSEEIKTLITEYQSAMDSAKANNDFKEADYLQNQIERMKKSRVIDTLSRYSLIPKYGFPVDVVELQIYEDGVRRDKYDLSRDLSMAISEYAPDSEVIVDGNKYTSQYVSLPKVDEFKRRYFAYCKDCGKINMSVGSYDLDQCGYCGGELETQNKEYFIIPEYGFKTGINKESTRMKPKRSYAGDTLYIGGGKSDSNTVIINNIIKIETSVEDELLKLNRSGFYMCPECGYSEIDKRNMGTPWMTKEHKNYRQFQCNNDKLERVNLGHLFKTDVARFSSPVLSSSGRDAYAVALSFLYALLEGISSAFNIERRDIDGLIELNNERTRYDVLIYDNVPGGAGHIKRLLNENNMMEALWAAKKKVSQNCCDEDTSCYNCLRNYYNQKFHGIIKRKYAQAVIFDMIDSKGFYKKLQEIQTETGIVNEEISVEHYSLLKAWDKHITEQNILENPKLIELREIRYSIEDDDIRNRLKRIEKLVQMMDDQKEDMVELSESSDRMNDYYLPQIIEIARRYKGVELGKTNNVFEENDLKIDVLSLLNLCEDAINGMFDRAYDSALLDIESDIDVLKIKLERGGFLESDFVIKS